MPHNLLISGGWAHNFAVTAPLLAACIDESPTLGLETTVVADLDQATQHLMTQNWDLITVYACWFKMSDARYSAEQRAQWARETSDQFRGALDECRRRGVPLLAVHTAPICFDDWDAWQSWLGGTWQWGTSFHPAPENLTVQVVGDSPIVAGLETFTVFDELYSKLAVSAQAEVQLVSPSARVGDKGEPMLWTHVSGSSKVVYSALGHDEVSLNNETHRRIIRRSVAWLMGASPEAVIAA